jgi:hypothetical protein
MILRNTATKFDKYYVEKIDITYFHEESILGVG